MVGDSVLVTVVDEGIAPRSQSLRADVSNLVVSALLVEALLAELRTVKKHLGLAHEVCLA